jgi:hypothetical protein
MGAFTLMEYDDPLNDDVLCLETANGDVLLRDRPETIDQYRRVADRLEALGLSAPESIEFVQQMHRILR